MEYLLYVAIGCMILGVFGRRILSEKALALLSPEEQARLAAGFSQSRKYAVVPVLIIAGLFFALPSVPKQWEALAYFGGVLIWVIYTVVLQLYIQRRTRELGVNEAYQRAQTRAHLVGHAGLLAFFCIISWRVVANMGHSPAGS